MAILRSLPPAADTPLDAPSPAASRHRLRAVDRDEVIDVSQFLPPGATWLPAPQHTLPTLPGQPPMVGYLVLIPADHPRLAEAALPGGANGTATGGTRASGTTASGTRAHNAGDALVQVDPTQRTAAVDGRELGLTYLEFELLAHLVAHPNRVHTRDQLVTTVWGYGHVGDGRTVDVHIARLRRKLGEHRQAIQTVRRVGYKYVPPAGH
jgi:hypothetical protein